MRSRTDHGRSPFLTFAERHDLDYAERRLLGSSKSTEATMVALTAMLRSYAARTGLEVHQPEALNDLLRHDGGRLAAGGRAGRQRVLVRTLPRR